MAFAVQVALKAAAFYDAQEAQRGTFRLEKDLEARLRLADEDAKARFAALSAALGAYENVKYIPRRLSYAYYKGKTVLARLTLKNGAVLLYLALEPEKLPKSYRVSDVSAVKRHAATPTLITVKTDRQLDAARKLIERLEKKFDLQKAAAPETPDPADFSMLPTTLNPPSPCPSRSPTWSRPSRRRAAPCLRYSTPPPWITAARPKRAWTMWAAS